MATRIIIDAGHGGFDNGAVYQGRTEKNDNLNLALALGDALTDRGYDVEFTRTSDVYDSPSEKARIANNLGGDLFISLHRNAASYPNQYSGVQTLVYDASGLPLEVATRVNAELERVGFNNINVEERKNLAVLRQTNMPAILIESGFIDNDYDNNIYDYNFEQIAEGIANAVEDSIAP